MRRSIVSSVALAVLIVVPLAGQAAPSATYTAGATAVAKQQFQQPILDEGGVVCQSGGQGLGGGCLPFPFGGEDTILVSDDVLGSAVAFQVCIDNNGDSVCTSGIGNQGPCRDEIFFSHRDDGFFNNPMGPLPPSFKAGCPPATSTGYHVGYVVFICTGVHDATPPGLHVHPASHGTAELLIGGGLGTQGDFCGAAVEGPTINKPYQVV